MQSPKLPVAVIAAVDSRVAAGRARALQAGLLKMGHASGSADLLAPLRLHGFGAAEEPSHAAAPP